MGSRFVAGFLLTTGTATATLWLSLLLLTATKSDTIVVQGQITSPSSLMSRWRTHLVPVSYTPQAMIQCPLWATGMPTEGGIDEATTNGNNQFEVATLVTLRNENGRGTSDSWMLQRIDPLNGNMTWSTSINDAFNTIVSGKKKNKDLAFIGDPFCFRGTLVFTTDKHMVAVDANTGALAWTLSVPSPAHEKTVQYTWTWAGMPIFPRSDVETKALLPSSFYLLAVRGGEEKTHYTFFQITPPTSNTSKSPSNVSFPFELEAEFNYESLGYVEAGPLTTGSASGAGETSGYLVGLMQSFGMSSQKYFLCHIQTSAPTEEGGSSGIQPLATVEGISAANITFDPKDTQPDWVISNPLSKLIVHRGVLYVASASSGDVSGFDLHSGKPTFQYKPEATENDGGVLEWAGFSNITLESQPLMETTNVDDYLVLRNQYALVIVNVVRGRGIGVSRFSYSSQSSLIVLAAYRPAVSTQAEYFYSPASRQGSVGFRYRSEKMQWLVLQNGWVDEDTGSSSSSSTTDSSSHRNIDGYTDGVLRCFDFTLMAFTWRLLPWNSSVSFSSMETSAQIFPDGKLYVFTSSDRGTLFQVELPPSELPITAAENPKYIARFALSSALIDSGFYDPAFVKGRGAGSTAVVDTHSDSNGDHDSTGPLFLVLNEEKFAQGLLTTLAPKTATVEFSYPLSTSTDPIQLACSQEISNSGCVSDLVFVEAEWLHRTNFVDFSSYGSSGSTAEVVQSTAMFRHQLTQSVPRPMFPAQQLLSSTSRQTSVGFIDQWVSYIPGVKYSTGPLQSRSGKYLYYYVSINEDAGVDPYHLLRVQAEDGTTEKIAVNGDRIGNTQCNLQPQFMNKRSFVEDPFQEGVIWWTASNCLIRMNKEFVFTAVSHNAFSGMVGVPIITEDHVYTLTPSSVIWRWSKKYLGNSQLGGTASTDKIGSSPSEMIMLGNDLFFTCGTGTSLLARYNRFTLKLESYTRVGPVGPTGTNGNAPLFMYDGNLFITTNYGSLVQMVPFNRTFTRGFEVYTEANATLGLPTIVPGGTFIFGSGEGLFSITSWGTLLWYVIEEPKIQALHFTCNPYPTVMFSSGNVIASCNNRLHLVDLFTGETLLTSEGNSPVVSHSSESHTTFLFAGKQITHFSEKVVVDGSLPQAPKSSSGSPAGIVIGVLVGLIVFAVLIVVVVKMAKKGGNTQATKRKPSVKKEDGGRHESDISDAQSLKETEAQKQQSSETYTPPKPGALEPSAPKNEPVQSKNEEGDGERREGSQPTAPQEKCTDEAAPLLQSDGNNNSPSYS